VHITTDDGATTSLRSRLDRAFLVMLALLLGSGLTGVVAAATVDRVMEELLQRDVPLIAANAAVLQALTDAETGERGFLLTGDDASLVPFERGRSALGPALSDARRLAAGDGELTAAVDHQGGLAEVWLREFAEPVIELRRTDPDAAAAVARSGEGRRRFTRFRAANSAGAALFTERRDAHRADAERHVDLALAAVAVFAVAGCIVTGVLARRTTAAVTSPLGQLRATLAGLADGDLSRRATLEGPREIREVARSVNLLADANEALMDKRLDVELAQETALARERQAVEHLHELDRARQELVASVSHELRTPLTSITGYLSLLVDDDVGALNDDQQRFVAVVQRNADRLLTLIEEILTFSKVESSDFRLDVTPVDLATVLVSVRAAMLPAASAHDVSFSCAVDDASVVVDGDAAQLERVVLNLAGNAIKFTDAGGKVVLAAHRRGELVELSVSDTGVGIPLAEQSRLFIPFYRASGARQQEVQGAGLGLAIVHTIVERHGGSVTVSSEEGVGTTVRVMLPALTTTTTTPAVAERSDAPPAEQWQHERDGDRRGAGDRRSATAVGAATSRRLTPLEG
jgi:signal transduction histidine kinase